MADNVQEIKDKLDLLEYLKPIIVLKPSGKNWKGLCPFHKEKTPSFMVSPDRGIWHCFGGCNVGGDIFSFVMKYENVEFYEALKILAEKAGIDLKRSDGDFQKYDRLYEINEAAKNFFKNNLTVQSSAYSYVKDRGLNPATIEEFEIGFAPPSSDGLLKNLIKLRFTVEDMERAGVIFRTERGTYWDRFQNRLIFPLYNGQGKVIGFTARILDNVGSSQDSNNFAKSQIFAGAKYINSPETPIFKKSHFLYGFHKAKNFIRENKTAVLVEGQMDFLMSWQDGLKNVVATSGTALTNDHLLILKRLADQLVLSFDNDQAGQAAAERSIDLAAANDLGVKILTIPNGKDPADIVRAQSGLMMQLVSQAQPAMNYYFTKYLKPELTKDIYQKKKNLRVILTKIKNIASSVERSSWVKELSSKTGFDENILLSEMEDLKIENNNSSGINKIMNNPDIKISLRKDKIVLRIFAIAHHNEDFAKIISSHKEFFPVAYQAVFDFFTNKVDLTSVDFDFQKIVNEITLQPDGTQEEFYELLRQLKLEFYKHRQKATRLIAQRAKINNDLVAESKALKEFDIISRELHTVRTNDANEKKSVTNQEEGGEAGGAEEYF